jgi:beta-fructofuranosidase
MTLRLPDHWIWDFWLITHANVHHLYFLKAPKAIGDPDARHWNVSIGHAVSADLHTWSVVADALSPSTTAAWDDKSTWTGSVIEHNGQWAMLYTGTSHAENGLVQRVGLATSNDLYEWERLPDPVLIADPEHYETLSLDLWHDEAWRDPWLFSDPIDKHIHVLLTARANHGDRYDRGIIGHARSLDLRTWEVLPPIAAPSGFGQLEVPQLIAIDDRWYILFASDLETQSAERRATGRGTGTYYVVGDSPYGPFRMLGDGALEADRLGTTYAGKIHRGHDGVPWFIAWNRVEPDGEFAGHLSTPRRVEVEPDGSLTIVARAS